MNGGVIRRQDDVEPLARDCCICHGLTTVLGTDSAYVHVGDREYRVHFHKACLNDDTRKYITQLLNKMAKEDKR